MYVHFFLLLLSALEGLCANQNGNYIQQGDINGFTSLPGERFNQFSWQLCSVLSQSEPGNIVISPVSIELLLKMLYEGASGATANDLMKALRLPRDKNLFRRDSSGTLRSLQEPSSDYDLNIGSKIFITENLAPKNWYHRVLYLYYHAYIEKLNFLDVESAAGKINNWVRYVTSNRIQNLISPDSGLESTIMLLVNAIYFKGTWVSSFPKMETTVGRFQSPQGPVDVNYMKQNNYFYYGRSEILRSQILRLPYMGHKFAMYIILPEGKNGLDELLAAINSNPSELRSQILLLEETPVEVILPKFKFDFEKHLKETLQKLGIRKIFESHGELKGFTANEKLRELVVSDVVQKATIDVNENGVVAAAATDFQLINKFGGNDEVFNASHPFLFFIEDEATGAIVFFGKIVYPSGYEVPKPEEKRSRQPASSLSNLPQRLAQALPSPVNLPRRNTRQNYYYT